ncbi:MAG: FAD-binding protein [Aeromicrobium sp.]|nr:FAD-binding protein [Aeromicrobium sp.]MDF1706165.1 FAD-binding protein [Aeromicrobium sp.]
MSWTTVEKGGCLLAPDGTRMGDESVGYSAFAKTVSSRAEQSFVVLDDTICRYVEAHEREFAELVEIGGVATAEDADAVAAIVGAEPEVVAATLAELAASAAGDRPDEHGRTDFGFGPLRPPYRVVRSIPALFHTQGGVVVDDAGAVVDADGRSVRGLYAAGGVAAGVSGRDGAAGYSSGNGLLTAIGLGRITGRHAAAQTVGQR